MATWLPLVTRLRNIAEHAVVDTEDDPFTHARTTNANILERLLIAPYWVHFTASTTSSCMCRAINLERMHKLLMAKGYAQRMRIAPGYVPCCAKLRPPDTHPFPDARSAVRDPSTQLRDKRAQAP